MKIVVASKNPVKMNAARNAFQLCFPEEIEVSGVQVSSDVADQPMSEEETLLGARNRARKAAESNMDGDFYVGIEGGIEILSGRMFAFAWIVVSNGMAEGEARTATFELPPEVSRLVLGGMELGDADDQVFSRQNSKQQNGAVGLLTHDRVTRENFYQQAMVLALIPFLTPELYPPPS
ncbi:inosine/xanthosine triphosphatase [Gaoshiqia sediminis]|uniref:Probable inosine/xanthosine triphosphatase n=1 Tax=Gaoshiqia sediminis TaxID=2986998 RepID=A0AA42C9I4_9BACT|nr:inosine/xanthosine triphosphatase [Gaoshiqia sediminis]MCW0482507.1 inosine/xanthosine triphosphatase [Gaoshiqia sediminis]